jgi:hypothetical protein
MEANNPPMGRTLRCWLRLFATGIVIAVITFLIVSAVRLAGAEEAPAGRRAPVALGAEAQFFQAFNGAGADRSAPLPMLMAAWATDPTDARTNLLLGLNHLWMAAEGDRSNPRAIEDLLLAEGFLARAQELNPADGRIPSWLMPVRVSLARIERHPERVEALDRELLAAYQANPDFHSFSVALHGFASPRESEPFQRGLAALRNTAGCQEGNATCQNRPRWPHNREAFLTFHADYELKAGHAGRAAELLRAAQAEPDYPRWPFRAEAEERLKNLEGIAKLYADGIAENDPPALTMGKGMACQSCHRGS